MHGRVAVGCQVATLASDARTVVATRYDFCEDAHDAASLSQQKPGIDNISSRVITVHFALGERWDGGADVSSPIKLGHDRLSELCTGLTCHSAYNERELLHKLAHTLADVASEEAVIDARAKSVVITASASPPNEKHDAFANWQRLLVGEQLVVDKETGSAWRRCITAGCDFAKHDLHLFGDL
eukprot:SAG31_NODE_10817_length_1093_cov_2.059356_2_plen_183_part_00